MNDQVLNEAIEDVKLIKQVINKTAESLLSLGKIFLWWGLLFLSQSLYSKLFVQNNYDGYMELAQEFPILIAMVYPAFLLLGIFIYLFFSRKLPLLGLSKKIMSIWLFIIGFNIIVPNLVSLHDNHTFEIIYAIKTPLLLVTFAIGLYFTYILSGMKFIKWMGIIYIVAGFFAFLPGKVPNDFSLIVWPLTFTVLGLYFSYRKNLTRGN